MAASSYQSYLYMSFCKGLDSKKEVGSVVSPAAILSPRAPSGCREGPNDLGRKKEVGNSVSPAAFLPLRGSIGCREALSQYCPCKGLESKKEVGDVISPAAI